MNRSPWMHLAACLALAFASAAWLSACGGGTSNDTVGDADDGSASDDGGTDDGGTLPPPPELQGPVVVDFETRPDNGFQGVASPVDLGSGATISFVDGALFDFTTADAWTFGTCSAVATSGDLMMGLDNSMAGIPAVLEITLATPAGRVDINLGDQESATIVLQALDAGGVVIAQATRNVNACPVLLETMTVQPAGMTNSIARIRISGARFAFDDLAQWVWAQP